MKPHRILVIDDEAQMRELIVSILTPVGFAVYCAGNGREGLNTFEKEDINLVITDILMPVTEGVETIREIRARNSNVPIVAISGGGRVKNLRPLEIAGRAGADIVLAKPFEPGDLLITVTKALAARHR